MMKVMLAILMISCSLSLYGQAVDVYGGSVINQYYGGKDWPHFNSKYPEGNGFTAGIGIDSLRVDWLMLRMTLQFERYNGEFTVGDGGNGGGTSTSAEMENSVLSLGVFPLNFYVKKRLALNIGMELSRLLDESFSGTQSDWRMEETPSGHHAVTYSQDLNERYDKFSLRNRIGLKARIAYEIGLTKRLCLVPQYGYYLGLSKEFREFPEVTKSMRHSFCLGIKRK